MVPVDKHDRQGENPTSADSKMLCSPSQEMQNVAGEKIALVEERESDSDKASVRGKLIGYAMVFFHAFCMTVSSASVQALRNSVPHFELVLLRFFTLTVFAVVVLLFKRESAKVVSGARIQSYLVLTALINTTTFTLYYASSYFISLGPIGGLYRATTLIVSMVLARWILKEELTDFKILAMAGSIIGMVLIVFPAIISAEVRAVLEAEKAANQTTVTVRVQAPPPLNAILQRLNSSGTVLEYNVPNRVPLLPPLAPAHGVPSGTAPENGDVNNNGNGNSNGNSNGNGNGNGKVDPNNNTLTLLQRERWMGDGVSGNGSQQLNMTTVTVVGRSALAPRLEVLGYVLILIAGLFNSAELVMLSGFLRSISPTVQAFWFGMFGTFTSAVIMLLSEQPTMPTNRENGLLFAMHGVGAAMSIFTFIYALKYLPASNAAISQSVHIALMYVAQFAFMTRWNTHFNSAINFSEMFGTALILVGVLTLPISEIFRYWRPWNYREQL